MQLHWYPTMDCRRFTPIVFPFPDNRSGSRGYAIGYAPKGRGVILIYDFSSFPTTNIWWFFVTNQKGCKMKIILSAVFGIALAGNAHAFSCNAGYFYNGMLCAKCPDDFPYSAANNSGGANTCYTGRSIDSLSNHSYYEERCYYQGQCTNYFLSCYGGYYDAGYASTNMTCTAVGDTYYSVYPASRSRCPMYSYLSGSSSYNAYGKTSGGDNANSITDCYIPSGTMGSDATGTYIYTADCKYSA